MIQIGYQLCLNTNDYSSMQKCSLPTWNQRNRLFLVPALTRTLPLHPSAPHTTLITTFANPNSKEHNLMWFLVTFFF